MTSKTPTSRSVVVESDLSAVGQVCEAVISELQACGFGQDEIFAVHLSLEEAFINAVKHGSRSEPGKEITIDYLVSNDRVEISVTDQGAGFDPESIPDPRCKENLYKTSGRGLFLIHSYMDSVEFNKIGNRIHMIKHIS